MLAEMHSGPVGTCVGYCTVPTLLVGMPLLGLMGLLTVCYASVPHVEVEQSSFGPTFAGSVPAAPVVGVAVLAVVSVVA